MIETDEAMPPENPVGGGEPRAEKRADPGRLRKHSVMIAGHRTSISLEDAFWLALERAARRRSESLTNLVTTIDANRTGNLSSAIRVHVLTELEDRLRHGRGKAEKRRDDDARARQEDDIETRADRD